MEPVSQIAVGTHQFWNRAGMITGLYLIIDGIISLMSVEDCASSIRPIIRTCIGIGFVIVDTWFLMNVQ